MNFPIGGDLLSGLTPAGGYRVEVYEAKRELSDAYSSGAIELAAYNRLGGLIYGLPEEMPVLCEALAVR